MTTSEFLKRHEEDMRVVCKNVDTKYLDSIDFSDIDYLVTNNFNSIGSNFKNGKYTFDGIPDEELQRYNEANGR